jgi:hypothetical protein
MDLNTKKQKYNIKFNNYATSSLKEGEYAEDYYFDY